MDKLDIKKLADRIKERKATLDKAAIELKAHFVGLDDIIDKIIKNIETWYCLPELLTRPAIVCLFGPTGVGKTDLVRRLVKILGFPDKFCEIIISNKGCSTYPWSPSVAAILRQNTNIQSGSPAIILLDEVQGFRTIDEQGQDIHDYKFKDVWTLLSDGKLPFQVEVESLMNMLWDYQKKDVIARVPVTSRVSGQDLSDDDDDDSDLFDSPDIKTKPYFKDDDDGKFNFYQLNYFKSLLRLNESLEEIALWTDTKKKEIIMERLASKSIYEEEDYTKCLIFISGNLDDAYGFTKDSKEVDVDADILHNMSKKINILDIKAALSKRFRPEQISRMGNCHIIYPSLSKNSFEVIIERKIAGIIERVKATAGIDLVVDKSINKLIYDNGVFPTQGTRPVFSTISEILETLLPNFLLEAIINEKTMVKLSYKTEKIEVEIGEAVIKSPYMGTLDKLKKERGQNNNRRAMSAVHEGGHAVAFAYLFKMSPSQIMATPASNEAEGFVYTLSTCNSKSMLLKKITVLLAGTEAERIIFGSDTVTNGNESDLMHATERAGSMIRKWAMSNYDSTVSTEMELLNNDVEGTNNLIETIMKKCRSDANDILTRNSQILKATVDQLLTFDSISPADFVILCKENGLEIGEAQSSEEVIYEDYHGKYLEYKGKK